MPLGESGSNDGKPKKKKKWMCHGHMFILNLMLFGLTFNFIL